VPRIHFKAIFEDAVHMDLTLSRQQVARALNVLEANIRRLVDALTLAPPG
jgi:hypothetical protein